eukprot:scpid72659/ scgid1459/ Inactive rhomboid protein 2; Rhomboid family member 2
MGAQVESRREGSRATCRKYAGLNLLALIQLLYQLTVAGMYGYAPLGIKGTTTLHSISSIASETGKVMVRVTSSANPYTGPSELSLILSNAAFTPCMRKDDVIFARYETINEVSMNGSCCGQCITISNVTRVSHCTLTDKKRCTTLYRKPTSMFVASQLCRSTTPHSLSNISRPVINTWAACCIGVMGHCHMTTVEECMHTFNGKWFLNKMCRQVNCIGEVCGGMPKLPADPNSPYRSLISNQLYRWITANFLHRGMVDFVVLLNIQVVLAWNTNHTG